MSHKPSSKDNSFHKHQDGWKLYTVIVQGKEIIVSAANYMHAKIIAHQQRTTKPTTKL